MNIINVSVLKGDLVFIQLIAGMRIWSRSDPLIFGPPDPNQVLFPPDPNPYLAPTCNNGFIKLFSS